MTTPIHRWKECVTYGEGFNGKSAHWTFDGKPCWLASGLCDRNGVEIYEGDIVQVETFEKDAATVEFRNGAFWLGNFLLGNLPVIYYPTFEVVGHIAESES